MLLKYSFKLAKAIEYLWPGGDKTLKFVGTNAYA